MIWVNVGVEAFRIWIRAKWKNSPNQCSLMAKGSLAAAGKFLAYDSIHKIVFNCTIAFCRYRAMWRQSLCFGKIHLLEPFGKLPKKVICENLLWWVGLRRGVMSLRYENQIKWTDFSADMRLLGWVSHCISFGSWQWRWLNRSLASE